MKTTTVKISAEMLRELQSVAKVERRSMGFLIRDSIDFWLAARREQGEKS